MQIQHMLCLLCHFKKKFCFFGFFFLPALGGLQDLTSLTKDPTLAPAVKAPSPNHWTAREFPVTFFKEK